MKRGGNPIEEFDSGDGLSPRDPGPGRHRRGGGGPRGFDAVSGPGYAAGGDGVRPLPTADAGRLMTPAVVRRGSLVFQGSPGGPHVFRAGGGRV